MEHGPEAKNILFVGGNISPSWRLAFFCSDPECEVLQHLSSASKPRAFTQEPCSVCFYCKKDDNTEIGNGE